MLRIEEAFVEFHADHPEVYDTLVRLARDAKASGRNKIGIGMLWEVMRWEVMLANSRKITTDYKLNNNFRSRYARLIMEQEPDLAGIFEVRELRTDSVLFDAIPVADDSLKVQVLD